MPQPTLIASDKTIPSHTDVVVIGGGIAGCATALELAERGLDVTICEKGEIACEQSSRNWGWCRQMGRDSREIPLIIESLKLWRGLNARLGTDTGFRQSGIIYLFETDAEVEARTAWYEANAKPFGLPIHPISGAKAEELQPGAAVKWKGALYSPEDGRAEPDLAVPAIALAARRVGAKILTRCAVRGIETSSGRLSSVVTEKGPIACDAAIDAIAGV